MKIESEYNAKEILLVFVIGLISFYLGYTIGREEANQSSREKFVSSVCWAINENILTINSNKVEELRQSGIMP